MLKNLRKPAGRRWQWGDLPSEGCCTFLPRNTQRRTVVRPPRARRARTPPSAMAESRGAAKRAASRAMTSTRDPPTPRFVTCTCECRRADSRSAQHACFQRLADLTSRSPEPTPTTLTRPRPPPYRAALAAALRSAARGTSRDAFGLASVAQGAGKRARMMEEQVFGKMLSLRLDVATVVPGLVSGN